MEDSKTLSDIELDDSSIVVSWAAADERVATSMTDEKMVNTATELEDSIIGEDSTTVETVVELLETELEDISVDDTKASMLEEGSSMIELVKLETGVSVAITLVSLVRDASNEYGCRVELSRAMEDVSLSTGVIVS